jgi:hypothetical protein
MGTFEPDSPGKGHSEARPVAEEPFPKTGIAEQTADLECTPKRPLWLRVVRAVGIALGMLVVAVVVLGVLLYNFGGMSGSAVPGTLQAYDRMVALGQAPPIQKRFVIPIPGCQCHSTDAVLTAQHTRRRMSECSKCHDTKPAHMEPGVL